MFKKFTTTGIGSLPHINKTDACNMVLSSVDIPFWPQLPKESFRQSMFTQFVEGMPFVQIDSEKERVWLDKQGDDANAFYEQYGTGSLGEISEGFASGFYEMENMVDGKKLPYLKGHVTGPLTFTLDMKDAGGRSIYFDEELREIALMQLNAKAKWQIERLGNSAERVIIFVDEPILAAVGSSAYLGVSREESGRLLFEGFKNIKDSGGISGIHSCGKADWELVIDSKPDIVNFDSYAYCNTFALYAKKISEFLENGGWLAFGAVPTGQEVNKESSEGVKRVFMDNIDGLSKVIDRDMLISRIILTPACGAGSLSIGEAEKVFSLLKQLKTDLIEVFGE